MADEYWRLPYTAAQLQGAATNQVPRVGSNGNWEVWDIDTSAWVDTGVGAQGDGVTSFNGRQGAILPESGDYSSFYAPSGYGLGATPKLLTDADDLNDINTDGWYCWNEAIPSNPPIAGQKYMMLFVHGWVNANVAVQRAWNAAQKVELVRYKWTGTWGAWEYVNPPLIAGQEYRTTERFLGKPVYVKAIDLGNLPNNTYKVLAHGVANCVPLRVYGRSNAITLPYSYNGANYTISATSANIIVTTNNDASASTATAVFYYTKSTD